MRRGARAVIGLVLLAFLSGCAGPEPFDRPNTWRPTGANDANLAVMAARPADLARGRGTAPSDGETVAGAVDRMRRNRGKPVSDGNTGTATGGAAALTGS